MLCYEPPAVVGFLRFVEGGEKARFEGGVLDEFLIGADDVVELLEEAVAVDVWVLGEELFEGV